MEPTEDDMIGLLQQLEDIFDRVYYVFDGTDELVKPEVESETLEGLIEAANQLKGNVIIASRPLQVLQNLECVTQIELKAKIDDMRILINKRIDRSPNLKGLLKDTVKREEIVADIVDKADGMFLHAALQVKALQGCPTLADVREELKNFPKDMMLMYKKTFERIEGQLPRIAAMAKMTLFWLIHAKEQLTVEDLQAALGVNPETFSIEEDRMPELDTIISACSGLVEHHRETGIVRLVHFTARDALESLLARDYPRPHKHITKILLQRMIDYNIPNSTVKTQFELEELLRKPLLYYAYEHWAEHVRECGEEDDTRRDVSNFLSKCVSFPMGHDEVLQPLHVAAAYNFPWFIEEVLASHNLSLPRGQQPSGHPGFQGLDVNARSRQGDTALGFAAQHGHGICVQALLRFPAIDVNTAGMSGSRALACAAWSGHKDIVERLLKVPGIDVNAVGMSGRTALMEAVQWRNEDIIERLLKVPGIDINVADEKGSTALMKTAQWSNKDVFEQLLKVPGINVNTVDEKGSTVLAQAAGGGRQDVVERLLKVPGIDVNAAGASGSTALAQAAGGGHQVIVERLLKVPGIDVNTVGAFGSTALAQAAGGGHQVIVERLLKVPGIDVNAVGWFVGCTALALAARGGHQVIVERLLKVPGIDVNAVDTYASTALAQAAGRGHQAIVERLLKVPGIDVNAADISGSTALVQAAGGNHQVIVERLLKVPGINVNPVGGQGRTALMEAAEGGCEDIVDRLLRVPGIDVNAVDGKGRTALMKAAECGHEGIVERLLRVPGINVNAVGLFRRTALLEAVCSGHTGVVEQLLEVPGIDANLVDGQGRTALMGAVEGGREDIVDRLRFLLLRGVEGMKSAQEAIVQMPVDAQADGPTPDHVNSIPPPSRPERSNTADLGDSLWAPLQYSSKERENSDVDSTSDRSSFSVESSVGVQPINPGLGTPSPTALPESSKKRKRPTGDHPATSCLCGLPVREEQGALRCQAQDCRTVWYHPQCVGAEANSMDWMCDACVNSDGTTGREKRLRLS